MKYLLFFFLASLLMISCGIDTREFYFDLEDFKERKVYKLTCEQDDNFTLYWEISSDPSAKTLTTIEYDNQLNMTSEMVEKFGDSGAELVSFTGYFWDDNEMLVNTCKVMESDVMLWNVTDDKFSYVVQSEHPYLNAEVMERKRSFITQAVIQVYGEDHNVLIFKDEFSYSGNPKPFVNRKYYAKGKGIVMMDFEIEGVLFTLQLEEVISGEEWDEMRSESL